MCWWNADGYADRWWSTSCPSPPDERTGVGGVGAGAGHSDFQVAGDEPARPDALLDWWNYFDADADVDVDAGVHRLTSAPPPPKSPTGNGAGNGNGKSNGAALNGNDDADGAGAGDAPFWMTVPKSAASLPNNDWYDDVISSSATSSSSSSAKSPAPSAFKSR